MQANEVQIEVNETWYITKLLIHGTLKYSDTNIVLGKFFFWWETWSCSSNAITEERQRTFFL